MSTYKNYPTFYAKTATEWRNWLAEHHESESAVWLIMYHKKSKVESIYYDEAVEQALCFGWIDSKPNKRDEQSFYLFFSKRNSKSNWSKANRERIEKLLAAGQIAPPGQAMIEHAKTTGTWTALMGPENGVIPDDLQALFDKNPKALENFLAFSPSSKRIILEWIMNAKRPATREKRIKETVELAEQNIKANHYRQ